MSEPVELEGDEVGVSVPATSANLGAGYDSVGVALDIPLVAVAVSRRDQRVIAEGSGAADLPTGDDNLVWQALAAWCDHVGQPTPDMSVAVRSQIPLQRGMGSSSAAAVAGLLLAAALTETTINQTELLAAAVDFEGHPDNAAAAIHGGLVVCTDDGAVTRLTPSRALRPLMLVPDQRVSTTRARAVLPEMVPLDDAAANAASAAATVLGLAGHGPLRASSMVDRLHEPARLPLMSTSRSLIEELRRVDVPAVLSGAGPAVLVVVPNGDQRAVDQVRSVVDAVVPEGRARLLETAWDLTGAQRCPAP